MGQVTLEQALQIGIQHHQAGQLQQAQEIYKQILVYQPNHPEPLHLLGLVSHQLGHNSIAIDLMRRAISIRPNWPEANYNLALALRASGQWDSAIDAYKRAITSRPQFAEAYNGLASAYHALGKLEEARQAYQQSLKLIPDNAEALNNLGVILQTQGQLTQSIAAYRSAIANKPDYAQAYANLGIALRQSGQLDEAIIICNQAIALNPQSPIPHDNLGLALVEMGRFEEAIAAHRQALSVDSTSAESAFNFGNARMAHRQLDDAMQAYQSAIIIRPDYAAAYNNLGKLLMEIGDANAGIDAFRRAATLKPDNAAYDSAFVFSLLYQPDDDGKAVAQQHFRWGQQHARPLQPQRPWPNHQRLRIGYVSPDFRNHPVGRFLLPLLQHHDHEQFEIFCYSDVDKPDPLTVSFQSTADGWRDISTLTHSKVIDNIRTDEIDILVDLAGHSTGNRLPVFAEKPASIQISYLGYPCTTGLTTINYRLTDHLADPVGLTEHLHTETLYRLPQTNWCFQEDSHSPQIQKPPCLHRGYITFGSFNNLAKVTESMLQTWRMILDTVPNSRLLLKATAFISVKAQNQVRQHFDDRLTLLGPQPDQASHMSTYNQIDISLDTFPYQGTATTCESLWMGVPVITLAGQSHISRVGVSLLTNIGCPDWIATTPDHYIHLAAALAADPARLITLRQSLRDHMRSSPLMDANTFTLNIEAAYLGMANSYQTRPATGDSSRTKL